MSVGFLHAQNSEIEKVFNEINSLIDSKNVNEILTHYNNHANKSFLEESQNHYKNLFELDSLFYFLKVNSVIVKGDTAKAIIFEKKSYYKYDRSNTNLNWLTYTLVKAEKGWVLHDMQDRNYLKAEYVELKMDLNPSEHFITASAKVRFSIIEEGETNLLFLLNRGLSINKITNSNGESLPLKEMIWQLKFLRKAN